jgi:hypothetical protein
VLEIFASEMWPMLKSTLRTLRAYLASGQHAPGGELPGKTFTATPGFEALQTGDGPLTHAFEISGVRARRMVVPYHVWMLQRLADVLRECTRSAPGRERIEALLLQLPSGKELLNLDDALAGCRVRKVGGRLFT